MSISKTKQGLFFVGLVAICILTMSVTQEACNAALPEAPQAARNAMFAAPVADDRAQCLKNAAAAQAKAIAAAVATKDADDKASDIIANRDAILCNNKQAQDKTDCETFAAEAQVGILGTYVAAVQFCAPATIFPPAGASCQSIALGAFTAVTAANLAKLGICLFRTGTARDTCDNNTRATLKANKDIATTRYNTAVQTANDQYDRDVTACPAAGGVVPVPVPVPGNN